PPSPPLLSPPPFPYTTLFRSPVRASQPQRTGAIDRLPQQGYGDDRGDIRQQECRPVEAAPLPLVPMHCQGRAERERNRYRHIQGDRKSTRLNSSHVSISYAVF